jgi:hypothetical protein
MASSANNLEQAYNKGKLNSLVKWCWPRRGSHTHLCVSFIIVGNKGRLPATIWQLNHDYRPDIVVILFLSAESPRPTSLGQHPSWASIPLLGNADCLFRSSPIVLMVFMINSYLLLHDTPICIWMHESTPHCSRAGRDGTYLVPFY